MPFNLSLLFRNGKDFCRLARAPLSLSQQGLLHECVVFNRVGSLGIAVHERLRRDVTNVFFCSLLSHLCNGRQEIRKDQLHHLRERTLFLLPCTAGSLISWTLRNFRCWHKIPFPIPFGSNRHLTSTALVRTRQSVHAWRTIRRDSALYLCSQETFVRCDPQRISGKSRTALRGERSKHHHPH